MRVELQSYIEKMEKRLKRKQYIPSEMIEMHLHKIAFFQHERLIHLLVVIFTGICLLITLGFLLINPSIPIFLLFLLIFILFTFYLVHYYYLENNVQKLYLEYDKMMSQKKTLFKKILKK